MIDSRLITQLEKGTDAERKAAVKALTQTKDPEALPYLAVLYQRDSSPEIREMARKAGIYIRKHAAKGPRAEATPAPLYDGAGDSSVSQEDREWADQYISRALDRHVHGDTNFAVRNLIRAFQKNPALMDDPDTREIAAKITELPPPAAIDYILEEAEKLKATGGKKRKPVDDDSYKGVLLWLAIYALSNIIIVSIGFVGGYLIFSPSVRAVLNDPTFEESIMNGSAIDPQMILNTIDVAGFSAMAEYIALTGIASIFSLLFQYFTIHAASTLMLGGDGTIPRLIRKLTPYMAFINPAIIVMLVLVIFLQTDNPFLASLVRLIPVVFGFGAVYLMAQRISETYRYGVGNGCVAMVLSNVLLAFFACGLTFMISIMTVGAITGAN